MAGGCAWLSDQARLTLSGASLSHCRAESTGGGVSLHNSASMSMSGGSIATGEAFAGGAVAVMDRASVVLMSGATLTSNRAWTAGGAVLLWGASGSLHATCVDHAVLRALVLCCVESVCVVWMLFCAPCFAWLTPWSLLQGCCVLCQHRAAWRRACIAPTTCCLLHGGDGDVEHVGEQRCHVRSRIGVRLDAYAARSCVRGRRVCPGHHVEGWGLRVLHSMHFVWQHRWDAS